MHSLFTFLNVCTWSWFAWGKAKLLTFTELYQLASAEASKPQPKPLLTGKELSALWYFRWWWHMGRLRHLSPRSLSTHLFISASVISFPSFTRVSKLRISCQKGFCCCRIRWCRIISLNKETIHKYLPHRDPSNFFSSAAHHTCLHGEVTLAKEVKARLLHLYRPDT